MNDVIDAGSAKTSDELAGLKTITQVVYAMQALSFAFGLTALIGLVINYVVVLFVAWVWAIYRVVKGWLKLTEGKPVQPSPIR